MSKKSFVSVIIPCLNEEKSIGECVKKAGQMLMGNKFLGEVIVVDNNSDDSSAKIARKLGARIVYKKERGYGRAYLAGLSESKGDYLLIADGDGTYDFSEFDNFIQKIEEGFDFVNGTRIKGNIHKGAMPFLHRYFGVPFLTTLLNLIYKTQVSDAHCGMRAFTREAYKKMNLSCTGMEFASEMIIKAAKKNLRITEIPINYYCRSGKSKLKAARDAIRHIRYILKPTE